QEIFDLRLFPGITTLIYRYAIYRFELKKIAKRRVVGMYFDRITHEKSRSSLRVTSRPFASSARVVILQLALPVSNLLILARSTSQRKETSSWLSDFVSLICKI